MCGICGVIGPDPTQTSRPSVEHMMDAMLHRGPDEAGSLFAPGAAIGMRRLSIVDLPGGSQPIWNEAETLAVVFNGEIYNFRELRRELESRGHRFRTRSDTETIVHAYQEWGAACADHLNGMFAFAVVEMPQGPPGPAARVFLARDRLGIKPLYYALAGGRLVFASEVRALTASGCIAARLSPEAVPPYLLFGSVCEPLTMVQGVRSLPPGYSMTVPAGAPLASLADVEPAPYWNFAPHAKQATAPSNAGPDTPAQRVRSLLEGAVSTHLVADVPVGIFLSSGLDSTALAALASRAQRGIHTFTVAFTDSAFSEAEIARRTAKALGTEHSEFTLSDAEMAARLDEAVSSFDQPSMDGINTYFVSWAARQAGLKVALSGLGSDELFGGYTSFRATSQVARAIAIARLFPRPIRGMLAAAFDAANPSGPARDARRKGFSAFQDPDAFPHPYFFTRLLFTPQAIGAGSLDSWAGSPWIRRFSDSARQAQSADAFTAVSCLEVRSYLVNTLLRDTDAMSMRHSLEVRVPFLDAPLVEYVLSLPESAKLDPARPKALLVDAVRELLPKEVLTQRKRTFTFPWENWLRGALGKRVAAQLADWSPLLEPHVGRGFALAVWKDFLDGRTTWSRPWSLYVLNEWVKRNLEAAAPGREACDKPAEVSAAS
jgi:asparagine synthase (glutamine-hydrolysing)